MCGPESVRFIVVLLLQLICVDVLVSDLLALRTEEEWEEVRQRISDLPQDEALTAEFCKVGSALLLLVLLLQTFLVCPLV